MPIKFGFNIEKQGLNPKLINQVHGNSIVRAGQPVVVDADGIITHHPETEIYVFTSDCLPLLFYTDDDKGPIAAIHCGWRGALGWIVKRTIAALHVPAKDLNVVFGPSIGPCCFAVRQDFIDTFTKENQPVEKFLKKGQDQYYFDLARFVLETQLNEFTPRHVHQTDWRCTVCSKPQLPSYRRDGTTNPQIRSWIRKT